MLEKLLVARVAGQVSSTYLKKFDNSEGNVVDHLIQRGSLTGCLLMESNKQVGAFYKHLMTDICFFRAFWWDMYFWCRCVVRVGSRGTLPSRNINIDVYALALYKIVSKFPLQRIRDRDIEFYQNVISPWFSLFRLRTGWCSWYPRMATLSKGRGGKISKWYMYSGFFAFYLSMAWYLLGNVVMMDSWNGFWVLLGSDSPSDEDPDSILPQTWPSDRRPSSEHSVPITSCSNMSAFVCSTQSFHSLFWEDSDHFLFNFWPMAWARWKGARLGLPEGSL